MVPSWFSSAPEVYVPCTRGSLVALSGDAFATLVLTVRQGGTPALPQAISIAVSTLMVVCCDVGLVYAAMVLRALRTRGAETGYLLHTCVLVIVALIEAGTYLYMSARYEQPSGWAWALILARAGAAPLLSVYLAMAARLPVTSRDMLHQAEVWQGIQLVREVIAVAADPTASLADKLALYEQSAVMSPADRQRLRAMIAVVQRRQLSQGSNTSRGDTAVQAVHVLPADDAADEQSFAADDADEEDEAPIPTGRYNAKRVTARLEATR